MVCMESCTIQTEQHFIENECEYIPYGETSLKGKNKNEKAPRKNKNQNYLHKTWKYSQ